MVSKLSNLFKRIGKNSKKPTVEVQYNNQAPKTEPPHGKHLSRKTIQEKMCMQENTTALKIINQQAAREAVCLMDRIIPVEEYQIIVGTFKPKEQITRTGMIRILLGVMAETGREINETVEELLQEGTLDVVEFMNLREAIPMSQVILKIMKE
ncbi:C protein [Feline paramyxovirus 163]|uniref:C protein n=1 Tax=Feline paramyxovirus 163 TaxID=2486281 RepID=UPI00129F3AF5|nr:C protein [Feline paramyxovirus 163]BBG92170.1 C protein [Feline paramyxovirus 163]